MSKGDRSRKDGKSESPEDDKKSEVGISNAEVKKKLEEEAQSEIDIQQSELRNSAINIPHSEINKSEIENRKSEMEVHHHPQAEKKGFKEYILEGLMIFLAVTMGFYAETIRETISENHTARDYAESMKEDLKKDTAELNSSINELKFVSFRLDTLVELVHTKKISDVPGGTWYYYGRFGTRYNQFQSVNATLEQLKSSGALRYFKNHTIANAIAQYDKASRKVLFLISTQAVQNQPIVQVRNELFDAYYFKPVMAFSAPIQVVNAFKEKKIPLLDNNPKLMIKYANYCQLKSFDNKFIMSLELNLLARANELLNVLDEEYKFEK